MSEPSLRVLSVVSELYPWVKTGGLADVAGALPGALASEGVAMRTLIPGYPAMLAALPATGVAVHDFASLFGAPARLLAAEVDGLGLFVLDAPHLYARAGSPYAGPDGQDFADNAQRFAALARVGEQIGGGMVAGFVPDVVHAHDWQAGLTPAYLRLASGRRPPSVMTVHNLAFQGQFPAGLLAALGLPPESYGIEGVEYYGAIGFLKAGLRYADRLTTVSPSYAAEICTPAGGMGLDGLLQARRDVLHGILNGIDEAVWNPASDPHLPEPFSATRRAGRAVCKAALQVRFGLDRDPDALVFGVVSRLTWQKGMDLLLQAVPALLGQGAQLAVLGAGEPALVGGFAAAAAANPGRVGTAIGYEEAIAHLVQGGADALLVPSRFEPCGLTQLCALRYGALPVVARSGGLADTVIDANAAALAQQVATGLQFAPNSLPALEQAIGRAAGLWRQPAQWQRIQRNAMRCDVGWRGPAGAYAALYRAMAAEAG